MYGSGVILILIFISSIPVIIVFIWLRAGKYQFSIARFFFALLAGATAVFPALILQRYLALSFTVRGRAAVFYEFFVRIALAEEISRLIIMIIFFWISGLLKREDGITKNLSFRAINKATAAGLIAGLGFAIIESAGYGAASMDMGLVLRRFFTAALHAACGARIGAAAVLFRTSPIQAIMRIITATAIHGVYNMMIGLPGVPSIAAIMIAVSALISSISAIRGGWNEDTASSADTSAALDKNK